MDGNHVRSKSCDPPGAPPSTQPNQEGTTSSETVTTASSLTDIASTLVPVQGSLAQGANTASRAVTMESIQALQKLAKLRQKRGTFRSKITKTCAEFTRKMGLAQTRETMELHVDTFDEMLRGFYIDLCAQNEEIMEVI